MPRLSLLPTAFQLFEKLQTEVRTKFEWTKSESARRRTLNDFCKHGSVAEAESADSDLSHCHRSSNGRSCKPLIGKQRPREIIHGDRMTLEFQKQGSFGQPPNFDSAVMARINPAHVDPCSISAIRFLVVCNALMSAPIPIPALNRLRPHSSHINGWASNHQHTKRPAPDNAANPTPHPIRSCQRLSMTRNWAAHRWGFFATRVMIERIQFEC